MNIGASPATSARQLAALRQYTGPQDNCAEVMAFLDALHQKERTSRELSSGARLIRESAGRFRLETPDGDRIALSLSGHRLRHVTY